MRLDHWLKSKDLTPEAFAERLGIRGMTVRRYCNGQRMPVPEIVDLIVRETAGEVTVQDLHDVHLEHRRTA